MKRTAAALFLCACAPHSVTVFARASEVPPKTVVVAAVKTGVIDQFGPGTRVQTNGNIVHAGEIVGHVAPSDVLVIEAEAGDKFGRTIVKRKSAYDVLVALGVFFLLGGTIGAWGGAAACVGSNSDTALAGLAGGVCIDIGFLGSVGAAIIGGPILAVGVHGELEITTSPSSVALHF